MPDQTNDQTVATLTVEGLRALYADLGEKTHLVYELRVQLEQLRTVSRTLLEQHAPGKCTPAVDDAPSDAAEGG